MPITATQFEEMKARIASKMPTEKRTPNAVDREGDLHDYIIGYCKARGWYYVHSRTDRRTTTAIGVPDFIIATYGGKVLWVEVKIKGNKPSIAQRAVGIMLRHLGQDYALIYSIDSFLDFVDKTSGKRKE